MAPRARRSSSTAIHIDGLKDFVKDIEGARDTLLEADKVYRTLAAKHIRDAAKAKAETVGRQQARASEDVRARAGTVTYGGKEWSFGAEFGSYQYDQFPEWRGNKDDAGYFLWPSVREFIDDDMLDLWTKEVWNKVAKELTDG